MTETTPAYDALYRHFDSPLMCRLREEAYGEDLGQHSWVTADELRADIVRLQLAAGQRMLDLGCGPGGPLVFAVKATGCQGIGLELSLSAIESARARARNAGVAARLEFVQADLDLALPREGQPADAAMALDVVLHLRDRERFLREVAALLRPAARLLFTDAGIVSGAVSNIELQRRSSHGFTQFVPPGFNERAIAAAGLELLDCEDRTASVSRNAGGRLRAMQRHRDALEASIGKAALADQLAYLETVAELADRRALTRWMFLVQGVPRPMPSAKPS